MYSASTQSKLAQLRVKTDRELSLVIGNSLESALRRLASAKPQLVRVEQAYAQAVLLLPMVDDLGERRRLKNKLVQVRENLERLSTADEPRVTAAYS